MDFSDEMHQLCTAFHNVAELIINAVLCTDFDFSSHIALANPSVRLSVCPSHSGISKRMHISLNSFHFLVRA